MFAPSLLLEQLTWGVAGDDVVQEYDYSEVYAPLNLNIGHCRLSIAAPIKLLQNEDPSSWSNIRVATKYPNLKLRSIWLF